MANPTTNYGFVLPTSTDLVTDLPADFDVALQGVDTRLKALNPETTLGDIAYRSSTANTNTRLGIGTTGQVLTVSGGVPAWTTPAAPAANWSLVNAGGTALTGAATITVSGISGADKIMVLVSGASSANTNATISLRLNTDTGSNYAQYGLRLDALGTGGAALIDRISSATSNKINIGSLSSNASSVVAGYVLLSGCNSSGLKIYNSAGAGNAGGSVDQTAYSTGGFYSSASTISSVSLFSDSGNFDAGTLFVYTSA